MYRCPFCHSTNIEQERDYNELKKELKEIMKEIEKDMPLELKQILNEAIVYDLYNDEQYLKNLELHGMTLFCNDCGYIFKEYDVVDDANFIPPTEISKEEFEQVILDALHKQRRTIVELDTEEKEKMFLQIACGKRKKFYKEMDQKVVHDLSETSKMLDEIELEEEENNNLPS